MAVKRVQGDITVVEAAKRRIRNVFGNDLHVYMSFSGGKDSLCLAQIVYSLIQGGEIDPGLLTVIFIDEEAIFPCIEETVRAWRQKFMLAGADFRWYCLEVRHFSCFNQLEADESFICWDHTKSDVWVRQPPPFAIRTDPCLKPRVDNYQAFLPRVTRDGIMLSGVRASESIQRLQYMAALGLGGKGMTEAHQIYPIYDWKTSDVWKFLFDNHVEIPDIYLFMWQAGIGKGQLRVSQFFSSDTAGCLVRMNEYYPDLMERVIRREPNAYLAALYWDSEMFGRSSRTRRKLEGEEQRDYKAELVDMLIRHPERHFHTDHQKHVAEQYRKAFIKIEGMARPRDYRKLYDGLVAGDPKLRTLRAVHQDVACAYAEYSKKFRKGAAANG